MKNHLKIIILLAIMTLITTVFVGCKKNTLQSEEVTAEEKSDYKLISEEDTTKEIIINAFGDNLIHSAVIKSGLHEDGSYSFDYMYEYIEDELSDGDINIINQETIFVEDEGEYSDYPRFGSPMSIGDALINSGFNVITLANNHSFDKGETGINDTIKYWSDKEAVTTTGIYYSQGDYDKVTIREVDGVKIAFLNYTFTLNGLALPDGKEYMVRTISDEIVVADEISRAKRLSDFVIVLVHWGREYVNKPTDEQITWAKLFTENGADCIIGTHPHVIEPLTYIECADGRRVPCFYSLGNCISSQMKVERMLGGMAKITLKKDSDTVSIGAAELIPTITHIGEKCGSFQVFFLKDYTDDMCKKHYLYDRDRNFTVEELWEMYYDITE